MVRDRVNTARRDRRCLPIISCRKLAIPSDRRRAPERYARIVFAAALAAIQNLHVNCIVAYLRWDNQASEQ
jgi:hypothetical protein